MKNNIFKMIWCGILVSILTMVSMTKGVYADSGVTLSPRNVRISLVPGETYEGSFTVANPARNDENYRFATNVSPFYVNDDYDVYFDANGQYGEIANWITVAEKGGEVKPNESMKVHYSIAVPEDAPAGGQYAAIHIGSVSDPNAAGEGINLEVTYGVAYIIYAEVIGSTTRGGEIVEIDVPGFVFSGNIKGSSAVRNTGNVHSVAKYTLQVYPLFSNEEIYTNEENADTMTILPDRTYFNETAWHETPSIGIFNVVYTVEFEGTTAQVKKLVIKCPIWLLFIIIFAIIALIMYFFVRSKNRKNNKKRAQSAKAE